jgi:hypothetical protein
MTSRWTGSADDRVPMLFAESAFDAGTTYARRLAAGGGELAHAALTAARSYAPLVVTPDMSTSPFQADLLCRCGAKNVDNACVGASVTAPYSPPAAGQADWFSQLWASEDAARAPGRAEMLLMARSGPQF